MSYATQLTPTIPVEVVDKGKGSAVALLDYGPEHDLFWVVFMDTTRECWVVPNSEIRAQANWTMGRR